ncbi:hypothetical protein CPB83DRAFT_862580 [Crepidotus variabilis]|uniref:Secreted protein n=1 Tax=Crepidotus variabilis TaxID=179855 RepID=A0A9P6JJT3_9AGAR|nr:hypothetical protein CPB83DRAFT_862580 [Crepidotus variabilis]
MVQINLTHLFLVVATVLPLSVVGAPVSNIHSRDDVSSSESILVREWSTRFHVAGCAGPYRWRTSA